MNLNCRTTIPRKRKGNHNNNNTTDSSLRRIEARNELSGVALEYLFNTYWIFSLLLPCKHILKLFRPGIAGIEAAYHNCVYQVQLYGPTNFAPVINHVMRFAQEEAKKNVASVSRNV